MYRSLMLFLIIVLSLASTSRAQLRDYTIIDRAQLKINNKFILGALEQDVKSALGRRDSVTAVYWEMSDMAVKVLWYGQASFSIDNSERLASFTVKDPDIDFCYQGQAFGVGDSISSVSDIMPVSYAERGDGVISAIWGNRKNGTLSGTDVYLVIEYNDSGRITNIRVRSQ